MLSITTRIKLIFQFRQMLDAGYSILVRGKEFFLSPLKTGSSTSIQVPASSINACLLFKVQDFHPLGNFKTEHGIVQFPFKPDVFKLDLSFVAIRIIGRNTNNFKR
jgi:hypothetical protein